MNYTDQIGNTVNVHRTPQRIISLVPSQTELLFDLGLEKNIVGITKFCIHPAEKVKGKTIIGGTKNFNFKAIAQLQPDLIIGNKEENYKEGIEDLQKNLPVWMSDMKTLDDAFAMMTALGVITKTTDKTVTIINNIKSSFNKLAKSPPVDTAYFIWKNPYMGVGNNTFINEMLQKAGFFNVFRNLPRYPIITPEALREANPKLILLSSEPYPFKEKQLEEFKEMCPGALVKLVDGELFSWYGSRLQYSAAYFAKLREEIAN